MDTRETLILKALEFKAVSSGAANSALVDHLLAQNPEQADVLTKNVCAQVPRPLVDEMEELGSLLDLSKREIVTLALRDFVTKAKAILDEFDAHPKGESQC